MKHLRLIEEFKNLFNTRQLDDLHDLLIEDFYFRNPFIEISGRDKYIHYVKDNQQLYRTETVNLSLVSEDEYLREYTLTFLDSSVKNNDQLHIFETLKVKDGLLASSVMTYDTDHLSKITNDIIIDATKNHGDKLNS